MNGVKIIGTGSYLPPETVDAELFDKRFNLEAGTTVRKSGVKLRHYAKDETQIEMGVKASLEAFKSANINKEEIDCIVFAGGVISQPIPCSASLIQRGLGLENSGIPCFDINSTCLSFVTAMDTVSYLVDAGKYKKVLIVSSDIASVGINYEDYASSILFGDAAAAVILEKTDKNSSSKIITYNLKTYSEGAYYANINGGGTFMHARNYNEETKKEFLFHMDGLKIYELASKKIGDVYENALKNAGLTIDDIKLVIPHQASLMSMKLLQKKLKIPKEKFMYHIENTGNTIATSIPLCLDYAVKNNLIERGDKVMLIGTSAGLSIGVMIFEY